MTASKPPPCLLFDLFPSRLILAGADEVTPSLVLCNHHHHADSKQQGQDLHDGLAEAGAANQELREHGHRGDVDEAAGGEGQDPGGGSGAHTLGQQGARCSGQSSEGCQQLQENGLETTSVGSECEMYPRKKCTRLLLCQRSCSQVCVHSELGQSRSLSGQSPALLFWFFFL